MHERVSANWKGPFNRRYFGQSEYKSPHTCVRIINRVQWPPVHSESARPQSLVVARRTPTAEQNVCVCAWNTQSSSVHLKHRMACVPLISRRFRESPDAYLPMPRTIVALAVHPTQCARTQAGRPWASLGRRFVHIDASDRRRCRTHIIVVHVVLLLRACTLVNQTHCTHTHTHEWAR